MDVEKLTKAFIAIRDKRTELKHEFDEQYKDLGAKMERLQAELLKFLQNNHSDAVRTEYGTVYRQEEVKPSCADWAELDAWEKNHPEINASDILEKRLSKKFIIEYMEANDGALPPGVNIYREYVARVRRS
jgi:rubrerythrin